MHAPECEKTFAAEERIAEPLQGAVVVLAASAGGLQALRQVLRRIDRGFPACCVVILQGIQQHPEFVDRLLGHYAGRPVPTLRDGQALREGDILVAPHQGEVDLDGDVFRVAARDVPGPARLDALLSRLAVRLGSRLGVILLSGHGVEGTQGGLMVRRAGGLVLAQDPGTAQAAARPRAAVVSGVATEALPPEAMAEALLAWIRRGPASTEAAPTTPDPFSTVPVDKRVLRDHEALLLDAYGEGVILDEACRVVSTIGDLRPYLEIPEGRPESDLLDCLRGDLAVAVRACLRDALLAGASASVADVDAGDGRRVDVVATPLAGDPSGRPHVHVRFSKVAVAAPDRVAASAFDADGVLRARNRELEAEVRALRRELAEVRGNLRTALDDVQRARSEFTIANEELSIANEELQNTNEELHAVNEELHHANRQMQKRNSELDSLTRDTEHLLRCSPLALVFLDRDLRVRKYNTASAEFFSLMPQDIGRPLEHIAYSIPLQQDLLLRAAREVVTSGRVVEREVTTRTGRTYLKRLHPYQGEDGAVDGVIITFIDVTSVKAAERAMHAAEERFRTAASVAFDPVILFDHEHDAATGAVFRIVEGNEAAERFLGESRGALIGRTLETVVVPLDDTYRTVFETGLPVTREVFWPDPQGRPRWVRQHVVRHSRGIAMTLADTTREREVEMELRLRDCAIESTPVGIAIIDLSRADRPVIYANRAYERTIGLDLTSILGRPSHFIDPVDGGSAESQALREALVAGAVRNAVIATTRRDGRRLFLETAVAPVRRPDGLVTHGICTFLDITARREDAAERARLEQKIQTTRRLDSLGLFASNLAHDFNNLLTSITNNVHIVRSLGVGEQVLPFVGDIELACTQGSALCRQLLAYSGKARRQLEMVDLAAVVDSAVHIVRTSLREGSDLRVAMQPGLPPVRGDSTTLRQVLVNLVLNARDATAKVKASIGLELQMAELSAQDCARQQIDLAPGRYLRLSVTDNGSGMDAEVRRHLFEPFFTTKESGHGLGLAAVLGIVRIHRGAVVVESAPGEGTRFDVYLPPALQDAEAEAVAKKPAPAAARPPAELPKPQPEPAPLPPPPKVERRKPAPVEGGRIPCILVVDDEPLIRTAACQMLERFGFRALRAADGQQALEMLAAHRGAIDGMLLDLRMPRLDGRSTLLRLRETDGDLPVVMMSGYFREEAVDMTQHSPNTVFLHKPFDAAALREKLRGVGLLAASPGA